jgi:hypothetical protein
MTRQELIEELQAAIDALHSPTLPERGGTAENLAYRRGVRDAYVKVLEALDELE